AEDFADQSGDTFPGLRHGAGKVLSGPGRLQSLHRSILCRSNHSMLWIVLSRGVPWQCFLCSSASGEVGAQQRQPYAYKVGRCCRSALIHPPPSTVGIFLSEAVLPDENGPCPSLDGCLYLTERFSSCSKFWPLSFSSY